MLLSGNIYNVDDCGFTVCQNLGKIVTVKEKKHTVRILTSAEKKTEGKCNRVAISAIYCMVAPQLYCLLSLCCF